MKGYIYKYTFPDGKVYIGQTRNPEKRKREHIDPKIGPVNTGFWEAYQRFGTYEYEVIREVESDSEDELVDLLNRYESGYIYQYKADNPEYGYNRTSYGTVRTKTNKLLMQIYNAVREDFLNSELEIFDSASKKIWKTKQQLTEQELFLITKRYPDEMWLPKLEKFDFKNLRKNRITEEVEFLLEEHLGVVRYSIDESAQAFASLYIRKYGKQIIDELQSANSIVQLDKDGNIIKEFRSFTEICQEFKVPRADNVRNVLRGKQKTAYGFFWKYKKDM